MVMGLWSLIGLLSMGVGCSLYFWWRTGRRLAQSECAHHILFHHGYHFLAVLDAKGIVLQLNESAQQMLDCTAKEVTGKPLAALSIFAQQEEFRQKMLRGLAAAMKGEPGWAHLQFIDGFHSTHYLDTSFQPIFDKQHRLSQILVEGRNVNRLRQAQQQLEQSRNEFWTFFEENPLLICRLNALGVVMKANTQTVAELGLAKEALEGQPWSHFYADKQQRLVFLSYLQAMSSDQVYTRDIRYLHQSGKFVWFHESLRKLPDSHDFLLVGENITENRRLSEELAYRATHDFLTGMYNRSYFEQQLEQLLDIAHQGRHALMFIDLDQFKVINDTQGHQAGDQVLKHIALLLQNLLPEQAILARLGGDEFGILLPSVELAPARELGQNIVDKIGAFNFHWEEKIFNLGCSVGLNMVDHNSGGKYRVMAEVDSACYAAKEQGRNRLHVFELDDAQLLERQGKMRWVEPIQEAIRQDRFILYAQPIVPMGTAHQGYHYEILARMLDKHSNIILPGVFLPVAEHYNLADRVDMVIVDKAFQWLESHPEHLQQLALCSINLSGLSLGSPEFTQWLLTRLKELTFPLDKLCFETTETVAVRHIQTATTFFSAIREMGCKVALDDFGSGLSSFGYLKSLPIDFLKIDGMFIRDLASDEMDFAMVKSINEVAHVLGKQTIAEFVEDQQIMDQLLEIGVDFAQGYFIDKPMPLENIAQSMLVVPKSTD